MPDQPFPLRWLDLQTVFRPGLLDYYLAGADPNPAQAAARAEQAREAAARAGREQALWREGERAARERLETWLTSAQRDAMSRYGWFDVPVPSGNHWSVYTSGGISGNVRLRAVTDPAPFGAAGRPIGGIGFYCAHPRHCAYREDAFMAQALTLKHDEAGFLAVANYYCAAED